MTTFVKLAKQCQLKPHQPLNSLSEPNGWAQSLTSCIPWAVDDIFLR